MARKNAIIVSTRNGKKQRLLRPKEKFGKVKAELSKNMRFDNFGRVKRDKNGQPLTLTKGQRAHRAGYRQAVIDMTRYGVAVRELKGKR